MNPLAGALFGNRALSFTGAGRGVNPLFGGSSGNTPGESDTSSPGNGGYGGINLGRVGSGLLQAGATLAPGYAGLALGAIQAGLRGANTFNSDQINRGLGGGGLNFGQWVGSVLGGNDYGNLAGNRTIANRDGLPGAPGTAVTTGGMYDDGFMGGGPFGIFSDPHTAFTPAEYVERRNVNPAINPNTAASAMAMGQAGATPSALASAIAGPATTPANPGMPGMMTPGATVATPANPMPDGIHAIPSAFIGTRQAAQYGYDMNGNFVGGNVGTAGNPGNFGAGQGAPGTVAGGTFGNAQTGGMAGPVNQNATTGMLSRA